MILWISNFYWLSFIVFINYLKCKSYYFWGGSKNIKAGTRMRRVKILQKKLRRQQKLSSQNKYLNEIVFKINTKNPWWTILKFYISINIELSHTGAWGKRKNTYHHIFFNVFLMAKFPKNFKMLKKYWKIKKNQYWKIF